jgi:hypothetical protein
MKAKVFQGKHSKKEFDISGRTIYPNKWYWDLDEYILMVASNGFDTKKEAKEDALKSGYGIL